MTNEVKEILDKWKCYIGLTKKFTTNEYEMLKVEDIDKILDYITNLQEEVNKLTAESTEWESKCYDLQEENERLKEENSKLMILNTDKRLKLEKEISLSELNIINEDLDKENERLNNVINELEKYLEEHSKIDLESSDIILHEQLALSFVYDYLKALKEGK